MSAIPPDIASPASVSVARVPPYTALAPVYDQMMGEVAAPVIWQAFCESCAHFGISFRLAADVGCGTGGFLKRLVEPGRCLYGVDRSSAMLRIAERRLLGLGVRLLCQDMKRLHLPERVDLITCNFATLNYAKNGSELRTILQRFHENIDYRGHLVFDIISCNVRHKPIKSIEVQNIRMPAVRACWTTLLDGKCRGSIVDMRWAFRQQSGEWHHVKETHHQRWYREALLHHVLQSTGFFLCGLRYLRKDGRAGTPARWIQIVAQKR